MKIDKNEVLNFIDEFNSSEGKKQIVECFTCSMPFWFAYILNGRFATSAEKTEIMYDDAENHFGCQIDAEVYDITGIVTNQYNWIPWTDLWKIDSTHANNIVKDCVLKKRKE